MALAGRHSGPESTAQSKPCKLATESAALYAINDDYQSNPAGAQVRTNTVALADISEFTIQIQNDNPTASVFSLKARQATNPGWDVRFLFNGGDVSAQLRSPGVTFPQLPPQGTHTVTVQMTPTNAPPGDQMRVLLELLDPRAPTDTLDVVEAVTDVAAEIIVNSTGDEPDADLTDNSPDVDLKKPGLQVTLRAAIDFANRRAGKDIIKFKIPSTDPNYRGGIPRIRPAIMLPAITDTVILDGWSQNSNSPTPPVEISGENTDLTGALRPSGLEIFSTQGCEIRGLAIFGFIAAGLNSTDLSAERADGILLNSATSCLVEGCHLGMDGPGLTADGNDGYGVACILGSDLNTIGGATPPQGNLITGNGLGGIAVLGSAFNFVFHNRIGLNAAGLPLGNGSQALFKLVPNLESGAEFIALAGIVVHNSGGAKVEDNRIAAQRGMGILLGTTSGQANKAQRNLIGKQNVRDSDAFACSGAGLVMLGSGSVADANRIVGNQSSGLVSSEGNGHSVLNNFIAGNREAGISFSTANGVVLGNRIDGNGTSGLYLKFAEDSRIGHDGTGIASPNIIINHPGAGIDVEEGFHLEIAGNFIGVEDDGKTLKPNRLGVFVGTGRDNEIGAPDPFLANTIAGQDEGILISDERNRISLNRFLGLSSISPIDLTRLGSLQGDGVDKRDPGDADQGGNTKLNSPGVISAVVDAQGTATVQIELNNVTVGEHWIGVYQEDQEALIMEPIAWVPRTLQLGQPLSLTLFGALQPGKTLHLTLTDPSGNTSEMGDFALIQGATDDDFDGVSDAVEKLAPASLAPSLQNFVARAAPPGVPRLGDGNGDGIPDAQQAHVTSFPGAAGRWITLVSPADTALENVRPSAPPDLTNLPAGYSFPLGFLNFGVTGLTRGGSVIVTNFFHDEFDYDTVFAYGPTPDNAQPHWYEFLFDGGAGAKLDLDGFTLTFIDGDIGDHDLQANGTITTALAPAYKIPPGPPLSIQVLSASTDGVTPTAPSLFTVALSWPASASDYVLQSADNLSPTNFWRSILTPPAASNGRNVVTNTVIDRVRFYRLRKF